ncbi:hypothetical protein [Oerskovia turbata]
MHDETPHETPSETPPDTRQAEFRDARLVEVYDAQNTWSRDDDYFLARVAEGSGPRVLDPVTLGDGRVVQTWSEVTRERDGVVDFTLGYEMPDGDVLTSTATLRFRAEEAVRRGVEAAGFAVEQVYGGWGREAVGEGDGELLVVARAV